MTVDFIETRNMFEEDGTEEADDGTERITKYSQWAKVSLCRKTSMWRIGNKVVTAFYRHYQFDFEVNLKKHYSFI